MLLFSSTIQPLHNLCQHILYVWMLLCCAKYPGTAFSTLQDLNSCLFSAHLAHSKFRDNDMADNEQQFDSSCALTSSRNPVIVCASFRLWFTRMDDAVTHCPQYWPLTPADCQTGCYNQPQTDDTCRDEAFSQSCSLAFTLTCRLSDPFVSEAQLVVSDSLAALWPESLWYRVTPGCADRMC